MWDQSSIIMGDQRGALMGQGIQQAGAAFSQGVQRYFQKKEKDKKEEATIQWLEQSGAAERLFPELGKIQDPSERRKVISAGIKGAGLDNMAQVAQLSAQQERQKMEAEAMAELRKSQAAENYARQQKLQQDVATAKREETAMTAAFDPIRESQDQFAARGGYLTRDRAQGQLQQRDPTPPEMVARYGRAGGRNPAMVKDLAAINPDNLTGLNFREDPVTGERFAISAKGSVAKSGVNPLKTPGGGTGLKKYSIGGRDIFVGPGNKYFDAKGQPVQFKATGSGLNPVEEAELSSLPDEIAQAKQKISAAAKESSSGNKKPGPDWMPGIGTYDERITNLQQQMQAKQQRLQDLKRRKNQGGDTEDADTTSTSSSSGARQPVADPLSYVLGGN